jgi:hypothetical protein
VEAGLYWHFPWFFLSLLRFFGLRGSWFFSEQKTLFVVEMEEGGGGGKVLVAVALCAGEVVEGSDRDTE